MNRAQLEHAIRAAGAISGDRELYVVGSQAVLGAFPEAPAELLRSMEVDLAPKNHPEREELIEGSIGELSPFHQTFGFYVDGVDIGAITLPDGWRGRVIVVENANTGGSRGLCLEPADLAISKLAAGRDKDLEFVRALVQAGLVAPSTLGERLAGVTGLAPDRAERLAALVRAVSGEGAP